MTDGDTPTFNMKAVVHETGLKPDTLRAWERRYGLPQPQRSGGKHRLYSPRDVEIVKWLMARQEEGISISRAVQLWKQLEAEGQDPLISSAAPAPARTPEESSVLTTIGDRIGQLQQAWLSSCLAFDEQAATRVVNEALGLYTPEVVGIELLAKALGEIGEGWYRGEITVQQEHFASALADRRLEAMIAAVGPPTRPAQLLIACPPGEEHTFSALFLTLILRRKGWGVVYLGANVPVDRLEATITKARPRLALFVAHQLHTAAALLEVAGPLRSAKVPFAFGGRIFSRLPGLHKRIPGHYLGHELEHAGQVAEELLTRRQEPPIEAPAAPELTRARDHFVERQLILEGAVWEQLEDDDIPNDRVVSTNRYMAQFLQAALALGDLAYLEPELAWIQGFLANDETSATWLQRYLTAYTQAAAEVLGEPGNPIWTWLSERRMITHD